MYSLKFKVKEFSHEYFCIMCLLIMTYLLYFNLEFWFFRLKYFLVFDNCLKNAFDILKNCTKIVLGHFSFFNSNFIKPTWIVLTYLIWIGRYQIDNHSIFSKRNQNNIIWTRMIQKKHQKNVRNRLVFLTAHWNENEEDFVLHKKFTHRHLEEFCTSALYYIHIYILYVIHV